MVVRAVITYYSPELLRKVKSMQRKKINLWPYLLISPALIIIFTVVFIPAINAILMSFQNYDLRRPKSIGFIGLDNYLAVLHDQLFWQSLWKTVQWVVLGVGFQFVFGFGLALLLNKKFFGRGIARSVSLLVVLQDVLGDPVVLIRVLEDGVGTQLRVQIHHLTVGVR